MSSPWAIWVSMSWSTLAASTPAHFSLVGTKRLFSAASAWASAASLPVTFASSDLIAGIVPASANCFWKPLDTRILSRS